ncbi:carboxymuconolactone decarboxylase family protein [Sphingomonas sp. 1P06PA]|uniref:(R)-mandelonitrile lyase n=1 Tax=Sphingomonas sp. 1P06PA TaxID=554121 RepID=UPI0039A5C63B
MRYAASAMALGLAPALAVAQTSVAPPAMQRWAPSLANDTDRILFGDIWRRPELKPRDRSLVTVAVLVTMGRTAQLEGHLGRALDNGVRPAELSGLVTHLAWYSGWPNAVSALEVVDRVMRVRVIAPDAAIKAGAPLPLPTSDADRAKRVERQIGKIAPKLAALTNETLFADLWRRPDLTPRDRSLVTIASLAAGGDADQLAFHVTRGIENGLTREQIAEALTHLAFYAGWPKAMAGVAVLGSTGGSAAAGGEPLIITPAGRAPEPGPASRFTGTVTVASPFKGSGDARLGGATVSFQPGARSNWHSHPLGQLLIVTEGEGRVQVEGGDVRAIRAGDSVWTAPGVRHWHGAAPTKAMTHVAVAESVEGRDVEWMEPVTERAYRAAPG